MSNKATRLFLLDQVAFLFEYINELILIIHVAIKCQIFSLNVLVLYLNDIGELVETHG